METQHPLVLCRWRTGLAPNGYMDRQALIMYGAPLIASRIMSRLSVAKPHSKVKVEFGNFPKEVFMVLIGGALSLSNVPHGKNMHPLVGCIRPAF
jgi:hypothetical protein